jgi:hypothetical protein
VSNHTDIEEPLLRNFRRILPAMFAIALSACRTAALSSTPSAGRTVSADDIIREYYAAVGGHDRIVAIHNRRMWGHYNEGDLHAATDIAWARSGVRRVNVHAPGFEYSEGFDGHTVWEYNHLTNHAVADTGAAEAAGRRGSEFDESIVDYGAKGYAATLLGMDSVGARPAYRVRVTLRDGWVKDYYFDPATCLILALRKAMPIHATGPAVESLTEYGDWRRESGVLQPYSFTEREVKTGRIMNTLQWDRIVSNGVISPVDLGEPAHR